MSADETVDMIAADLRAMVNDSIATLTWARAGMEKFANELSSTRTVGANPDPVVTMGHGDPNSPDAVALAQWTKSETVANLSRDGRAWTRLGCDWIVSIFQSWEDDLRPRLATVWGVPATAIQVPLFGDLRLFRHDIIHKRSIATAQHSARAELFKWFAEGNPIVVRPDHLREFVRVAATTPIEPPAAT